MIFMKISVFNGSPSGKNSTTNVIVSSFLKGAQSEGAEINNIFLCEKHIEHCKGCFACWFRTPGKCVCQDDMAELLCLYNTSDIVCFATPVFTWNYTAYLKNFVDRLAPLKSPLITEQSGNYDLADTKSRTQRFMVIANCGFPGDNNFEVMKASFACCEPFLEIYRNCGKLLKATREDIKSVIDNYLSAVEQAGREAMTGDVSEETRAKLNMPLMSVMDYVKYIGMG